MRVIYLPFQESGLGILDALDLLYAQVELSVAGETCG